MPHDVAATLSALKDDYLALHTRKEDLFWAANMGLSDDLQRTRRQLAEAEIALNHFVQDPARLARLRELDREPDLEPRLRVVLRGWIAMLAAHVIEDPAARRLSDEIVELEAELARARGEMELGFTDPATGRFCAASSVKLRLLQRTEDDEDRRRAAYEGMRSIEQFVLDHGFLEIVRKRNQLGRMLGYEDYYDWRVSVVEGMRKRDIFALLEQLARQTEAHTRASLEAFERRHGAGALEPWNFEYLSSGSIARELDPYFPFSSALRRWAVTFDRLGIRFRSATLTLDLVDRPNKYENGFMHGPEPAFFDADRGGAWRAARINFTANAIPEAVGSGMSAMTTLFHEGGHAAHFANILSEAPCFAQEFAPTSVAYAETQSMFLDSLLDDADWMRSYARNGRGELVPMSLVEERIREEQPLRGFNVRAMLTIPLAERAIYEIPDDELTPERVLKVIRGIEKRTQGLTAGLRPVLAVPHLLSGESSAYYHGYIMAEMAVHQTRNFFLARDGHLTDNPRIGPELAEHYWRPGNAVSFDDTLKSLTGRGLSVDALADACNRSVEEAIAEARNQVAEARRRGPSDESLAGVDLDATVRVIHGRQQVCDTAAQGFEGACEAFEAWVEGLVEAAARPALHAGSSEGGGAQA